VTVCLFIGLANIIGIFGMKPPTKDLNVSGGLAIMSIVLVEAAGIRAKKVSGWLKSFTQPIAIITPINILEIGIRPLSLCMRLFGNVLGSFIIMELIKQVVPILAPPFLSLYFDFFDGFIQAYVFVFLTGLYIKDAVGEDSAKKRKAGKTARIAGASADTAKA
jgi:F-type H+-transporting ATPase subunit a